MLAHTDAAAAYTKRFEAVLAYIDANLEGDLSVDALSRIANFSMFHFHRQFVAYVDVPVARYVQLMRLRRAGRRLAPQASCPVLDAALEHCGSLGLVNESARKFIDWRIQSGQSPVASSRTFGIPHGNPDTVPADEFRFDICGEIDEPVAPNLYGVRELVMPGGRCAVVRHTGLTDHIGETMYPVYRDWLPSSGEELRDHPLFFHYLSVYPETPLDQWQTDIYIPLV
ncbi:AraC family transcriptional regulator [Paraburkholderia tuberum]|nr:GyrI-like domain-containing protein [Paraburkholderia tuberum]